MLMLQNRAKVALKIARGHHTQTQKARQHFLLGTADNHDLIVVRHYDRGRQRVFSNISTVLRFILVCLTPFGGGKQNTRKTRTHAHLVQ